MASTLQTATVQLGRALALLEGFLADTRGPEQLLRLLGWGLPPGITDIGLAQLSYWAARNRNAKMIASPKRMGARLPASFC